MGYVDSLKVAADFAKSIGENDKASAYELLSTQISSGLKEHWNGTYLYEAHGRE